MAIDLAPDPDNAPGRVREHCCFCFRPTAHWYAPKDVAVCISCAEVRDPAEVPTKAQWCASVRDRFPEFRTNHYPMI